MVINKNKSTKPVIQIKEMHKWFGNFHVLKNIFPFSKIGFIANIKVEFVCFLCNWIDFDG